MGKAPKLLTILVDRSIADWDEVHKLEEQGHTIVLFEESHFGAVGQSIDQWLGPKAHRMDSSIRKHFPEAIAEARRIKYPKGEK